MAKRPHTNKLWEPFSYVPPGACPKCGRPTIVMAERDTMFMILDEDGVPTCFSVATTQAFHCVACGFDTEDYIATDKGYRYNPYGQDEFLKELNKIDKSESGNSPSLNPFVKEF